jgi:hypothetical protein
MPLPKVDLEALKKQEGDLTDAQNEAIAAEALAEMDNPGKDKTPDANLEEDPKDKKDKTDDAPDKDQETELSDEEILSLPEEGLSEAQKTHKAELIAANKKKEEEELLQAKDEDLDDSGKAKKAEIVKAREAEKEKAVQAEVESYAKENNISVEEAKVDLESIAKIQEKYKGDPKQLAKANLNIQRLYTKTESELSKLKEGKQEAAHTIQEITVDMAERHLQSGKVTIDGKEVSAEKIIELYRELNPDITETLSDDKVLKLAAKEYAEKVNSGLKEQREQISVEAKKKRDSLPGSLSEADKIFWPEIKPIIDRLSDAVIVDERFNLETYVRYAKGAKFDELRSKFEAEKKEFGDKEYKRGLEEAKILGVKRPPDGKPPVKKITSLTDEQKIRAEEMFDSPGITKDKAHQLYREYLEETEKP